MTTNAAESHMNILSISKDLIKQTYHNKPPLKDPLYAQVRSTTILEMQSELRQNFLIKQSPHFCKWFMQTCTNWLTNASIQHNSTMDKATSLISSLFCVASSWDMPFCQPQYVCSIHASWTYLCISVLLADNVKCCFMIAWYGFPLAYSLYFHSDWWRYFAFCSSFAAFHIECSIAENEAQWPPYVSVRNWL